MGNRIAIILSTVSGFLFLMIGYRLIWVQETSRIAEKTQPLIVDYATPTISPDAVVAPDRILKWSDKMLPLSRLSVGNVVHSLQAFSRRKQFEGLISEIDYKGFVDYLLQNQPGKPPRVGKTRFGARFFGTRQLGTDGEAHPYQALAVLSDVGLNKNDQVQLSPDLYVSADSFFTDCAAMFDLHGEFEWSVIALVLQDANISEIRNRYGERYSMDEIVKALLSRQPGQGACQGVHVVEALVLIEHAFKTANCNVSDKWKKAISNYLDGLSDFLFIIQAADGSLPSNWGVKWRETTFFKEWKEKVIPKVIFSGKSNAPKDQIGDILSTTHHVKWMLLRKWGKKLTQVSSSEEKKFYGRANLFLAAKLEQMLGRVNSGRQSEQITYFCPISHCFQVLTILNSSRR